MLKKQNRFFDKECLKVILEPSRWQIVSSLFPAARPEVLNEQHYEWMQDNCDCHPRQEVMICLRGECIASHQRKLFRCIPGTILLFDENEMHDSFYPPTTSGVTHLWLSCVKDAIIPSLVSVDKGVLTRLIGERVPVLQHSNEVRLFLAVWKELRDNCENKLPESYKRQKIIAALAALLLELVGMGYKQVDDASDSLKHQKQVISLIKEHIIETGGCGVNLEQLAHTAGYSKFHFLRMFKEHVGCTVHSFINQQRISVTKELLISGYRKNEIADQLGFSSPAVFSRWYSQHFKST